MVALLRTSGIPAVYVHGKNHYWSKAYIDGKWIVLDTTNNGHDYNHPHWTVDHSFMANLYLLTDKDGVKGKSWKNGEKKDGGFTKKEIKSLKLTKR